VAAPRVNRSLIESGVEAIGLVPPPGALDRLERYVSEIELWNAAYGLVNDSGDSLIVRHILDSLSALPAIAPLPRSRAADVGSGAGLPGIPLAIFLPDSRFTLIERSGKRCRFLENQIALLGLSNASLAETEVEKARGPFDLIVFRAFRPLEPRIVSSMLALLSPGGALAAYKGRREKIEAELKEIEGLGARSETIALKAPYLDEERHLVILRAR
jgi:16S rRNA (guanine527-N7)-methyltransferase